MSSRPQKNRNIQRRNRPQSAHFCRILNRYAGRQNDPIWQIVSERMLNISVIKSVGYLTVEVRGRVDRQKIATHRAEIAQRDRISAEFRICIQGVKTAQSGKL